MRAIFTALHRALPAILLLLLFAGLIVYPVVEFLSLPFFAAQSGGIAHLGGVSAQALGNSVRIGLESTLCSLIAGVPLAWLLERRRWALGGAVMASLWLVFVTPSYLMTTGWQIFFAQKALAHGVLAGLFFSEWGIVFLLALKGLPFATLAARTSWHAIGAELDDAARLLIPGWLKRHGTVLQLLLPAVASAFAIVFVEDIQEFGIPATLGAQIHLPIVTYAIYERLATTPVDFSGAALLSWQLLALALIAVAIQLYFAARFGSALVHGRRRAAGRPGLSFVEGIFASAGLAALIALGLAVPLTAMVAAAITPFGVAPARAVPWDSIVYSLFYALLAALAAVALTVPVLLFQRRQASRLGALVGALSLANMALPGVVLGAAYLIAFNSPWLPLYGTPLLLIIGYVAVQVPMLLRFLQAPIEHIHPNLSEAARLHGVPLTTRLLDIDGPLLAPALAWGWMMAFVQVFFELPISELLYPPGRAPAGVALVWLNQTLDYTGEARLALAAMAASLLAAGAGAGLLRALAATPLAGEPA